MSESDHDGDCPPEPHVHIAGIAVPVPKEIVDQRRMRAVDTRNRLFEFLDSLTVQQCDTLRWILNTDPDRAYAYNQYIDGQIVQLMRLRHDVDPDNPFDNPLAEPTGATNG